jgi:hypothetical protein
VNPDSPSFERVDYSLRTNKNIERKLVFEKLHSLNSQFPFRNYRYLGLGSMWFVDFIMAHRILHISDMWSFEESDPERATFNRPYCCIDVRAGSSGTLLDQVTADQWAKPFLAWLDYDGRFDTDIKRDVEKLLSRAAAGSVIIVSVNARHTSYRSKLKDDPQGRAIETLRLLLGDSVPPNVPEGGRQDLGKIDFPPALSKSILNFMSASVRTSGRASGRTPDSFVPLFNFLHQDVVEMVTVGGFVVSESQLTVLAKQTQLPEAQLVAGGLLIEDKLDLIPITAREKLALDSLLPCLEEGFSKSFAESGLKLNALEASKYRRLYPHFPIFVEMFG